MSNTPHVNQAAQCPVERWIELCDPEEWVDPRVLDKALYAIDDLARHWVDVDDRTELLSLAQELRQRADRVRLGKSTSIISADNPYRSRKHDWANDSIFRPTVIRERMRQLMERATAAAIEAASKTPEVAPKLPAPEPDHAVSAEPDHAVSAERATRYLSVSKQWLIQEAKAGRIPSLVVGKRRLFVVQAVRAAILERAAAGGSNAAPDA